uniref:Uncharacterized protein n=1 Tax=Ditylenchus dipsaci TaxID=166011 RepID=A0A915CTW0_9BILA
MTSMKFEKEPTECYELAQMTDFQEILEHEMLGCPTCLRIKTRNALGNQACIARASTSKVGEKPVTLIEQKPVISPSAQHLTRKNLIDVMHQQRT